MQEAKHRARKIDIERLESMVRIIKQDLKGRRPVPNEFDPKELLVKPVPGRAHGGGIVVWPATQFAVQCQAIYGEFFGKRCLPARNLLPKTPEQLAESRVMAAKPCLSVPVSQKAAVSGTLTKHLREHASSVKRGIAALEMGADRGPLGAIPRQGLVGDELGTLKQMVEAVGQLDHDRHCYEPNSKRPKTAAAAAAAAAAASSSSSGGQEAQAAKQLEILAAKRQAAVAAVAGVAPEYVGPRGERWQKEVEDLRRTVPMPSELSYDAAIKVFMGPGCMPCQTLTRLGLTVKDKLRHCDVVVVDSIGSRWEEVAALEARLYGLRLADAAWVMSRQKVGACVVFARQVDKRHSIYLSEAFQVEQPNVAKALLLASARASKWAHEQHVQPTFSARIGKRPQKPQYASTTYMLYSTQEYEVWAATGSPIRMKYEFDKEAPPPSCCSGLKSLALQLNLFNYLSLNYSV